MHAQDLVLSVRDLEKSISGKKLIQQISFDIRAGEVFGFLGPNGAGKTTTIRMLVGLMRPSGGTVHICGHDLHTEFTSAMQHVGCIVENPELYKFLTGRENLEQFARMLDGITEQRIHEVVTLVGLENRIDDKVKTYSLGMRQRLGIAQALLASPRLLILDEPTNGLDPIGIRELREFVRKLAAEEQVSVFISSHMLSEIEMMCDTVAIIHHGRSLYSGTVTDLINKTKGGATRWRVSPVRAALDVFRQNGAAQNSAIEGDTIITELPSDKIAAMNALLVEKGIEVYSIQEVAPTLEELFLQMTGGDRIA